MHTTTTLFSALLALPLVLAAPNFRLHPGTVRRSAREPREWRQDDTTAAAAAAAGSRFVRMDMRRKAPTHNLVPQKDEIAGPAAAAVERRATTIVIDDYATTIVIDDDSSPTTSTLSSFIGSSSDVGTLTISDDVEASLTTSFAEASQTPSAARANATAMLKDVAYGVKSEFPPVLMPLP